MTSARDKHAAHSKSRQQPAQQLILNPAELGPVYAMRVMGDCMEPDILDGGLVAFERDGKIEPGGLAIIYLHPEFVRPGHLQAAVKRIVMIPPGLTLPARIHPDSECVPCVVAEQVNPPRRYFIRVDHILAMHKGLGVISDEQAHKASVPPRALVSRDVPVLDAAE